MYICTYKAQGRSHTPLKSQQLSIMDKPPLSEMEVLLFSAGRVASFMTRHNARLDTMQNSLRSLLNFLLHIQLLLYHGAALSFALFKGIFRVVLPL